MVFDSYREAKEESQDTPRPRKFAFRFTPETGKLEIVMRSGIPIVAAFLIVEADGKQRELDVDASEHVTPGDIVTTHVPPTCDRVTVRVNPPVTDEPEPVATFDPRAG